MRGLRYCPVRRKQEGALRPRAAHGIIRGMCRPRVIAFALVNLAGCTARRSDVAAPLDSAGLARPSPQSVSSSAAATPPSVSAGPSPAPGFAQPALAQIRSPSCDIAVEALLDANVYRGSPSSPMKYESYRRDPRSARMAQGIDHGAHYLSCNWRVRVNDARYRYEHTSHGGPANSELRADLCSARAEAQATVNDIARFTDHCADLHRGEYYGDVLVPDEATASPGSP